MNITTKSSVIERRDFINSVGLNGDEWSLLCVSEIQAMWDKIQEVINARDELYNSLSLSLIKFDVKNHGEKAIDRAIRLRNALETISKQQLNDPMTIKKQL